MKTIEMKAVLIGYALKKTRRQPDWLPQVDEIASVSNCMSRGPGWDTTTWQHNDYWFYDTTALAKEIAADLDPEGEHAYDLYAFKLFPIIVDQGQIQDVEPLDDTFEFLGFDAVSRSQGSDFECSPLSCNGAANEMRTNRFCLFSTLEEALAGAREFSSKPYEPGPYYVMEVYRSQQVFKE
jgi:hypothetical protein